LGVSDVTGLRARVAAGERLVGTFSLIPATEVVELIALAGFDFVVVDMEHGPYTIETVHRVLVAAQARGLATVVRVPEPSPALIGSVLDLGADGVLVPQVSSAQTARLVVESARFTPEGSRGANPWVRAARFQGDTSWPAQSNASVLVMVMIEGVDGVRALPEILAVPGLDAIFMGPVDLSHSLGVPGQTEHPEVLRTLTGIAGRAAGAGVATAVFAPSPERARTWWDKGITLVACGVDTKVVLDGLRVIATGSRP
jgi:4-hydroxy-2-oxoheptanedioate aldolase